MEARNNYEDVYVEPEIGEDVGSLTVSELIERYGVERAKQILERISVGVPWVGYGKPQHIKALLKNYAGGKVFTAVDAREFLRRNFPEVNDPKLNYTKVGCLKWNEKLFMRVDSDKFKLTSAGEQLARILSPGVEMTTTDLVIMRGLYLRTGYIVRTYALFHERERWELQELIEEYKKKYPKEMEKAKDPDRKAYWDVSMALQYLMQLKMVNRVKRGVYELAP